MRDVRSALDRYGDLLLAVAVIGLGLLQTVTDHALTTIEVLGNTAVAVAVGALLTVRRRIPLVLLAVLLAAAVVEQWIGRPGSGEVIGLAVVVVVYTAAAHTDGRRMWLAAAMAAVTAVLIMVNDPDSITVGGVIFFGILFGGPWTVGRLMRHRRAREALLVERADRLELDNAEDARRAVEAERQRIARELHDVVTHAISVVVLQARGGRRMLDVDPTDTRIALDAIERTGEQALREMRRLLGLLRASDVDLAHSPQPSLSVLDELVEQVRASGLPVDVEIEGEPVQLAPGVDLSAYRIVQEALTNCLKHAGPSRARVRVVYGRDDVELEIVDDGRGDSGGSDTGHGLVGIRERVAVVGGELVAGARPEGGFALRAVLPYAGER